MGKEKDVEQINKKQWGAWIPKNHNKAAYSNVEGIQFHSTKKEFLITRLTLMHYAFLFLKDDKRPSAKFENNLYMLQKQINLFSSGKELLYLGLTTPKITKNYKTLQNL